MQILNNICDFSTKADGVCVTVGTFDGVHRGHAEILRFLKSISDKKNNPSIVFTFKSHPRYVLKNDAEKLKILTDANEKAELIKNFGIDYLLVQDFNKEFASYSAEKFVKEILVERLNTKCLIIGHDHLFGKDREGNFEMLEKLSVKYGFSLLQINAICDSGFNISSTKIRNLLSSGNIGLANEMLGYNYSIEGKVVRGNGVGHKIGFPTANIKLNTANKLLPANGVYIVYVEVKNQTYEGVLSVGNRPTFNGSSLAVEVHLFNFNEDIYDTNIKITFLLFLREEFKFESVDALVVQMRKDCDKAFKYFNKLC